MDADLFDQLSRIVSGAGTRRRMIALLAALPLVGAASRLSSESTTAKPRRRNRSRGGDTSRRRHRDEANAEACIPTGKKCPSKKPRGRKGKSLSCNHCCQGFTSTNANGQHVCACKPKGTACTDDSASACCSGICAAGACQDTVSACTATCTGCCSGRGACQPGTANTACGTGGAACQDCGPCQTCTGGVCTPIADSTCCPGGICVGGACQARATLEMCGGRCDTDDLPATFTCTGGGTVPCPACDTDCVTYGCADGGTRLFTSDGESFYCVTSVAPTPSPCKACPAEIPSPIFCPIGCQTPGSLCQACPAGEGCLLSVCVEICTGA